MSMNRSRGYATGGLEDIRARYGGDRLRSYFREVAARRRQQAVTLMNDRGLLFYSLYLLMPEIESQGMVLQLNARNLEAFRVSSAVLKDPRLQQSVQTVPEADAQTQHNVLKWMLQTGAADDGADNSFDGVLDAAAALLSRHYQDSNVLPVMADLIFKRNRSSHLIHDIAWAYFSSCDPLTLRLVAGYLRSSSDQDYELACLLLGLNPLPPAGRAAEQQKQYTDYIHWLNENYDYMYATGESFQQTSNPMPFAVNPEAKYLGKAVSPAENTLLTTLTAEENTLLDEVNRLAPEDIYLLTDYSAMLREKSLGEWRQLLIRPVSEQLAAAKAAAGGAV